MFTGTVLCVLPDSFASNAGGVSGAADPHTFRVSRTQEACGAVLP